MYIYERLKELREEKNITQLEMANILYMKQPQYNRYETGKREIPLNILICIADYFNVSLDYLVGRSDNRMILK